MFARGMLGVCRESLAVYSNEASQMLDSVKWANGSAKKTHKRVGPRHDPYDQLIVTIKIKNNTFRLTSCSLAETILIENVDTGEGYVLPRPDKNTPFQNDFFRKIFDAKVIELTGFDTYFWNEKLWKLVDNARWKRDPDMYEVLSIGVCGYYT
jgi:hypothetical protein